MSFRARVLLGFAFVSLLPLAGFGMGIRRVMTERITAEYLGRVNSLVQVIQDDVDRTSQSIRERLRALAGVLSVDNRFRLAAAGASAERPYLLDYAEAASRLSGLAMLQIQDEEGRVVSSGHFRHEFGRLEAGLPDGLAGQAGAGLVEARSPDGPFIALASVDSVRIGDRWFYLVGGVRVDDTFLTRLSPGDDLAVSLRLPGAEGGAGIGVGTWPEPGDIVGSLSVPLLAPGADGRVSIAEARIEVMQPTGELRALRRNVDAWFAGALGAAAVAALVAATWLAGRVSRPLMDLAAKTARLDLDRLDVRFETGRGGEVGRLSTLLASMTGRLRTSVERLKDAERRAAVGELARQVNHDIKNGLTPIRNVVRHLASVEDEGTDEVARVFHERRSTLESSIEYLEDLAANYARLTPRFDASPCAVNDVVDEVVSTARSRTAATLRADLTAAHPVVLADRVVLRRILDNLVGNALDALEDGLGSVTVTTALADADRGPPVVSISVADDGVGMTPEQARRAFEDFYTTKDEGTGLGLSVVRRLVMDLSGTLDVDSTPGRGTTFIVRLPAVDA